MPERSRPLATSLPLARARIALVVDLPVKELGALETLDEYIGGFISDIAAAWGPSHPILLDLNRYGREHLDRLGRPIIEHLFDCARQKKLKAVPVAGTDRGPGSSYKEAIARIAARDQRGAALRLPYEDFSGAEILEQALKSALETLRLAPEQLDVFLDAGSLPAMPSEQAEEDHLHATVLQALLLLGRYRFRNIVFAGSSVPESLRATADGSPARSFASSSESGAASLKTTKSPSFVLATPEFGVRDSSTSVAVVVVRRQLGCVFRSLIGKSFTETSRRAIETVAKRHCARRRLRRPIESG